MSRIRRALLNWRWWVVLPFMPLFFAIALMSSALSNAEDSIHDVLRWTRRGAP